MDCSRSSGRYVMYYRTPARDIPICIIRSVEKPKRVFNCNILINIKFRPPGLEPRSSHPEVGLVRLGYDIPKRVFDCYILVESKTPSSRSRT